jgi:hypothetical protein
MAPVPASPYLDLEVVERVAPRRPSRWGERLTAEQIAANSERLKQLAAFYEQSSLPHEAQLVAAIAAPAAAPDQPRAPGGSAGASSSSNEPKKDQKRNRDVVSDEESADVAHTAFRDLVFPDSDEDDDDYEPKKTIPSRKDETSPKATKRRGTGTKKKPTATDVVSDEESEDDEGVIDDGRFVDRHDARASSSGANTTRNKNCLPKEKEKPLRKLIKGRATYEEISSAFGIGKKSAKVYVQWAARDGIIKKHLTKYLKRTLCKTSSQDLKRW